MTGDTSRQTAVLSLVMENVDGMQSERMKKKEREKGVESYRGEECQALFSNPFYLNNFARPEVIFLDREQ